MEKTIEIPEGYETRIDGNKVILEKNESEDEKIRKALIEVFKKKLERGYEWVEYGIPNRSVLNWLEKQKEHPAEWSEEDETCLEDALWCVMKTRHFVAKDACDLDACRSAERWLNFLPKRFNLQPKQEWSDVEKMHLANAILAAEKEWGIDSYTVKFLESLRPSWKPSEEQMEALRVAAYEPYKNWNKLLQELYIDLKKL